MVCKEHGAVALTDSNAPGQRQRLADCRADCLDRWHRPALFGERLRMAAERQPS